MLRKFEQHKVLAIKCDGKQGFINYMSYACDYPKEKYDDNTVFELLGILITELTKEGASEVVRHFFEKMSKKPLGRDYSAIGGYPKIVDINTLIEYQISAIQNVRIRDDKGTINGFTEEAIKSFEEDVEPVLWPTETNQIKKALKDIRELLDDDSLAVIKNGEVFEIDLDEFKEDISLLEKAFEKSKQYKDALELASLRLAEDGQNVTEVVANLLKAVSK